MLFFLVREVSRGQKRVNGRVVDTMQAVVNFGTDVPELATRHLIFGERTGYRWTGRNSDETIRAREKIIRQASYSKADADRSEARVADLQDKFDGLKGKRGVLEERQRLQVTLKSAEAVASIAKRSLERSSEIAGRVDETHPEFIQFV